MSTFLQLTWLEIIKASFNDLDSPIASFPNFTQAFAYAQSQNGEEQTEKYQIVTNDGNFYWVVTTTLAQQLIANGFSMLSLPSGTMLPLPEQKK
jgi:hypothetical protein